MPITYILQQLDALKNVLDKEINRLNRFYFDLKSENRKEIQELKNRIQLLEQSHSANENKDNE